ncbi:MAG: hypothetical protein ACKOQ6_10745 [Bacteroidota bacterium]
MRLSLIVVALSFSIHAQSQDARQLLRGINNRFLSVKDYKADVLIRADIPFVRMMPVNATVLFRQPDRFKVNTKGIAILPRQGFDQLFKNLRDTASFFPVMQGKEKVQGADVQVVNILPLSDTVDLILGKLWVDERRQLILRSQVTSRTNGTVTSDYFFGKHATNALPDSMTFIIDTKKFKIPKAVAADLNDTGDKGKKPQPEKSKGSIKLYFSNYIINKGIPDDLFK